MSRVLWLFSAVVLCACMPGFARADALTRDQAISVLIAQVINPSPNKDTLMAFGPQNMLQPGTVVEPSMLNTPPYPGSSRTIQTPTWFFWINDEPEYRFVHACRFIYIDATRANPIVGDGIIVETQGWWPKINGVEIYEGGPYVSPDLVYGNPPSPPNR
ncbi:hypothetical protein [Desulfobacca acetoxidans]|uniref:Uncharacterized protein n=1 Tax=Desulfobacca acetoxidans (strain ATCC 700848 / DSM 11109 / ASRB2) TaxID=880072 RepID=F2NC86_DESAR|nr:hypothetical protein [Desulfobacca acetoxidans]AEB08881.1 hypothetical protein Desac_1014 [Desulfobacca acetoxidans DSM 11109]